MTSLWAQIDDLKTKKIDIILFKRHFMAEMPEECMMTVKRVSDLNSDLNCGLDSDLNSGLNSNHNNHLNNDLSNLLRFFQ